MKPREDSLELIFHHKNKHLDIIQTKAAIKGKIFNQLPLKHIFGFCEAFEKSTEGLGTHITVKTAEVQESVYTTLANDITVTINLLNLFVPILIPDAKTQVRFNDSIQNTFTSSFDSWTTKKKFLILDYNMELF